MSKNIQASLIRYNGDIGPTILDVDDKTEGPDGTTKPLTKDMLQQMIVANFPELQNVKDAGALAELELIKQQQSEILQRLNQPIDTQLSGSNVDKLAKAGMESLIFQRSGEMESMVDETIVNIDGECVLESLTIGADTHTCRIMIHPKNAEGYSPDYLQIPHPNGSRLYSVQPIWLNRASGENDFFSLHKYDIESNEFIITMKRVATFANGVRIRIGNQSSDTRNISTNIMVSRKQVD